MDRVEAQEVTEDYAVYLADCMSVMPQLPEGCVGLSLYSPPFGGLYTYSSDPRDLSNSIDYKEFFEHYEFVVREIHRLTMPGRMTAVRSRRPRPRIPPPPPAVCRRSIA